MVDELFIARVCAISAKDDLPFAQVKYNISKLQFADD